MPNHSPSPGRDSDFALDRKQGCAARVIRSFAGFLDLGAKFFALAGRALHRSPTDASKLELDVTDDGLQAAPGSGSKDRPDLADRRWRQQIHEYYGLDPYWNPAADKGSTASAGR